MYLDPFLTRSCSDRCEHQQHTPVARGMCVLDDGDGDGDGGSVWVSSMWLYLTLMHYVDVEDLEHSGFGVPCMIV